jgi:competence protein ComEC
VTVLGPISLVHGTDSDPNNDSLVLRVVDAGVTLLLTGDVEVPAQQALVAAGTSLRADVLKVPHHGAADQDPAFLAATRAKVAVISVGARNTYGQPAGATVSTLAAAGMQVLRTDQDGDVAVVVRGGRLGVVRHRGRGSPTTPVALAGVEPGRGGPRVGAQPAAAGGPGARSRPTAVAASPDVGSPLLRVRSRPASFRRPRAPPAFAVPPVTRRARAMLLEWRNPTCRQP